MTQPEFSVLFHPGTDRPEPATACSSILVCPVLNGKGLPKFAVVLYNKDEIDSFSEVDTATLKMICDNLWNVLHTVVRTGKMKADADRGETRLQMYSSIIEMMPKVNIENVHDISVLAAKTVQLLRPDFQFELSSLSQMLAKVNRDFLFRSAFASELQEFVTTDNKRGIYCGLFGTNAKPLGVLALASVETLPRRPSRRPIGMARQVQPVHEQTLVELLTNWKSVLGPVLEVSLSYREMMRISQLFVSVANRFPRDPAIGMRVFNDLQLVFPCSDFCVTSQFLFLPFDHPEFQQKYLSLIRNYARFRTHPDVIPDHPRIEVAKVEPEILFQPFFNIFGLSPPRILGLIEQIFESFAILKLLDLSNSQFRELLFAMRSLHSFECFESWELAVDHLQWAAAAVKQIPAAIKIAPERIAQLFIYLLALYSNPAANESGSISQDILTKFYLENGTGVSLATSFYLACSLVQDISMEPLNSVMRGIQEFELLDWMDAMLTDDLVCPISVLARFSYYSRAIDIARKWVDLRFPRSEAEGSEELRNLEIEFELRTLIVPGFGELLKKGIRLDMTRKSSTTNISQIAGVNF
jgi:hypothetical protein